MHARLCRIVCSSADPIGSQIRSMNAHTETSVTQGCTHLSKGQGGGSEQHDANVGS